MINVDFARYTPLTFSSRCLRSHQYFVEFLYELNQARPFHIITNQNYNKNGSNQNMIRKLFSKTVWSTPNLQTLLNLCLGLLCFRVWESNWSVFAECMICQSNSPRLAFCLRFHPFLCYYVRLWFSTIKYDKENSARCH